MSPLPLIAHRRMDAVMAWRGSTPVSVRQFLSEVEYVAAQLPPGRHVLNLCVDRYRFSVALMASIVSSNIVVVALANDILHSGARGFGFIEAGWAVGMFLARGGDWDPAAPAGWAPEVLGQSVLAAAVTAATLARIRHARGIDPEDLPSASHEAVVGLTHVAEAAYYALDDEAQVILSGGFGIESQVIENILLAALDFEDLGITDIHRLSGSLFGAFLAGLTGEGDDDVDDEPNLGGQDLLAAAYATGADIHHHDDDDEMVADPFDLPTGRPPERHLVN